MNQELLSQFNAKAKEVKEDMIDFAQRLIRTPSESGKEGDVAQVILAELKKLDFDEAYVDPIGNVIGIIKGTGDGPNILYNCHMDHVAPGNLDDWEYPPYSAEIADGWLHGRAASDTKVHGPSGICRLSDQSMRRQAQGRHHPHLCGV